MDFIPDKCIIYGKNNETLSISKIDSITMDTCGRAAHIDMDISFDSNGELFSLTIPDEINKGKEETEMEYSLIKCDHIDAYGNISNYEFYIRFPTDIIKLRIGDTFSKILSKSDCYCEKPTNVFICKEITGITKQQVEQLSLKEFKYIRIITIKYVKETSFKNGQYIVKTVSGARRVYDSFDAFNNVFTNISIDDFIDLNSNIRINSIEDIDFTIIDKFYGRNTNSQNCDKNKEDNIMTNPFNSILKNMTFGQIKTDDIKYSFNSIVFKNEYGEYAYLNDDGTFVNVGNMIIDIPIFVAPVSIKDINIGDIIRHNNEWVIISGITDDGLITITKPKTREVANIIPEKSIFGFDFCSKVINIFEHINNSANKDNPFGNLLPFIMMNGDTDNKNTMLMYMMMNNGNIDMNNPMLLSMFMNDKNDNDLMSVMMMMNSIAAQNKK